MLKVLMQNRADSFKYPGGDTIQMLKTKEALEKLGIHVEMSLDLAPGLEGFDIVHVFNLVRTQETFMHVVNAKRHGVPVVLSTIYWNFDELNQKGRTGTLQKIYSYFPPSVVENLKDFVYLGLSGDPYKIMLAQPWKSHRQKQILILSLSDVWLPNAESELQQIKKDFNVLPKESIVVPNAIDKSIFKYNYNRTNEFFNREFILSVGLLHARKNHISLVKAVKQMGIPLLLVGQYVPRHKKYYDQLMAEIQNHPDIKILAPQSPSVLAKIFNQAKVHALPSWLETPGLVNLEAFASGCNIVVSRRGSTEEYFGKSAIYCEPDNINSIVSALQTAMAETRGARYNENLLEYYTWDKAAQHTLRGYELALKKNNA